MQTGQGTRPYDVGMAEAGKGRGTGIALAVFVGGPALAAWVLWAFILGTIVYSAVVATNSVATGQYVSVCTTPDPSGQGSTCVLEG
jgi:hypothetical protein